MTKQQSEGEVHVAAMRLILAAMERSEDPPDWTIWQHMLSMLETIFQGIEDQRRDDRDELINIRLNRDHWRQARQDAIEAGELMRAEIDTLRQQLANAQQELSEQGQVHGVELQRETADLRQQLADAQREAVNLQKLHDHMRPRLDAAQGQLTRERLDAEERGREMERLWAFVELARGITPRNSYAGVEMLRAALSELDAGTTEPAPVAEPLDAEGNQP